MVTKPYRLMLTGLKGSHPLSALAAFGLLRCLSEASEFGTPRLHWELHDDWLAVLTTQPPVKRYELVDFLIRWTKSRARSFEFAWADKIGVEPNQFVTKAREFIDKITPKDRSVADFFAAFGCELIVSRGGKLIRTALDMTDGQQGLMKSVRELADSLVSEGRRETNGRKSFEEAVFGPWRYEDTDHALGWDPSMESLYALRANDPQIRKNQKKRSVRSAIYLAVEALPLFPCAPVGKRLVTRGFNEVGQREQDEMKDTVAFSWPVWNGPLCVEEIRSLLALKTLTLESPPLNELRARGIAEVFRSHKVKTGGEQGNRYIFRTAYSCTRVKER
jgi:hypothetical protein